MRLYTRTGAAAVTDPETGTLYEADDDGAFEFPQEFGEKLRRFHVDKKPMWEDDIERQRRLMDEELERAKDPATLLSVVQQLAALVQPRLEAQTPPPPASEARPAPEPKQPAKRASKRAAPSTPPAE